MICFNSQQKVSRRCTCLTFGDNSFYFLHCWSEKYSFGERKGLFYELWSFWAQLQGSDLSRLYSYGQNERLKLRNAYEMCVFFTQIHIHWPHLVMDYQRQSERESNGDGKTMWKEIQTTSFILVLQFSIIFTWTFKLLLQLVVFFIYTICFAKTMIILYV